MPRLKTDQTVTLDIGNANGVRVDNLSGELVSVFFDWYTGQTWSSITGELRLPAGQTLRRTRLQLGHDQVRVGVRSNLGGADVDVDTY